MVGAIFAQSDLSRSDGQVKMQNRIIDAYDITTESLKTLSFVEDCIENGEHYYFETFMTINSGDSVIVMFDIPDN